MNNLYICPITLEINDFDVSIEIDTELFIRKITEEERCVIFGCKIVERKLNDDGTSTIKTKPCPLTYLLYPEPTIEASGKPEILVLHYYKILQTEYIIESTSQTKIEDLINTLLIFKEGFIHAPYSFKKNSVALHHPLYLKQNIPHVLELKDIENIKNLYNRLSHSDNKTKVYVERYRRSLDINLNDRESYFQKVSLLESCLIEAKTELTFKFSLCLSSLLTNEIGHTLSFREAQKIYKTRSDIAHKGKSDKLTKKEYDLLRLYTREIIKWYILKGSPDKILESVVHKKLNI